MIRLNLQTDPYWIDLDHDVRLKVKPLDTSTYEAAKSRAKTAVFDLLKQVQDIKESGGKVEGIPDLTDRAVRVGYSEFIFTQSLAITAILDWQGVLTPDSEPAELNRDNINALMSIHNMAESFLTVYTQTHESLIVEGESCGSGQNGTIAAGPDTVDGAEKTKQNVAEGNQASTANSART